MRTLASRKTEPSGLVAVTLIVERGATSSPIVNVKVSSPVSRVLAMIEATPTAARPSRTKLLR